MLRSSQTGLKEARNASSPLLIGLALIISALDLFAMVSGHVCADVTLVLRDVCKEGTRFRIVGITPVFFVGPIILRFLNRLPGGDRGERCIDAFQ